MGYLRAGVTAAALAAALVVPAGASAQINAFGVGSDAGLGPEGATVSVPVTVNCDPGWVGYASLSLSQSTGHRLVVGSGLTEPTIECTGEDQTLTVVVGNYPGVSAWKQGRASVSGTLDLYDPSTYAYDSASVGPQEIRIRK